MAIQKIIKKISILILSTATCLACYLLCLFLAEKYFFDKFFYQKSTIFGYWPSYNFQTRDIFNQALQTNQKDKFVFDKDDYIIAIIGDSYVWGEGIKDNQRLSNLLEKKLNKIRPTKIISIGIPGDSIFNYFKNYQKLSQIISPNLYIFPLVYNDALIRTYDTNGNCLAEPDYQDIQRQCSQKFPKQTIINEPYCYLTNQGYTFNKKADREFIANKFAEAWHASWQNPINLCIVNTSLQKMPTTNAIYFITEDYQNNDPYYAILKKELSNTSKTVVLSSSGLNGQSLSSLQVSQNEPHPSALANQIYTEILFKEITSNSKWQFK